MAEESIIITKTIRVFIITIILGFVLFALPNLFLGITKNNGGLIGINLLIIAIFQFITICSLINFSLRLLRKNFEYIDLSLVNGKRDVLLGLLVGVAWSAIQFKLIIPHTGRWSKKRRHFTNDFYDGWNTVGYFILHRIRCDWGGE